MTASVWGQGLAAIRLSADAVQLGMQPGDEECHICRDEIPATIAFLPCRHKVCFGCVENMRAKNIFKVRGGRGGSQSFGAAEYLRWRACSGCGCRPAARADSPSTQHAYACPR